MSLIVSWAICNAPPNLALSRPTPALMQGRDIQSALAGQGRGLAARCFITSFKTVYRPCSSTLPPAQPRLWPLPFSHTHESFPQGQFEDGFLAWESTPAFSPDVLYGPLGPPAMPKNDQVSPTHPQRSCGYSAPALRDKAFPKH